MRKYKNDYGITFMPIQGGAITVLNYQIGFGSVNPNGLGGSYAFQNLEEMETSFNKHVWIIEEEKKEIKEEMKRVNKEAIAISDKNPIKIIYRWNKYQDKYAIIFINKNGYQIDNADFVGKNDLEVRLNYLRKHTKLPIEEIIES